MTHYFGFLIALLLALPADFAFAMRPMPVDALYTEDNNDEAPAKLFDVDAKLSAQGFDKFEGAGEAQPVFTIDWIDRFYYNENTEAQILLKAEVEVSANLKDFVIYQDEEDFFVHIPSAVEGKKNALYFSYTAIDDVKKIITAITGNTDVAVAPRKTGRFMSLVTLALVPPAQAQLHTAIPMCEPNEAARSFLKQSFKVVKKTLGCIYGTFLGVWDATGGGLVTAAESLFKTISSPVESFRAAKKEIKKIGHFVANFSESMGDLREAFDSLPEDIRTQIICQTVANLGTSTVLMVVSGGAAGALLMRGVINAMEQVNKVMKLGALAKLQARLAKRSVRLAVLPNSVKTLAKVEKAYNKLLKAQVNRARDIKRLHYKISKTNNAEKIQAYRSDIRKLHGEYQRSKPNLLAMERDVSEKRRGVATLKQQEGLSSHRTRWASGLATVTGICSSAADVLRTIDDQMVRVTPGSPAQKAPSAK